MKYGYVALIAIASTMACAAPTASTEDVGGTTEALNSGVTATVAVATAPSAASKSYKVNVTVTNKSANPMSSWQVAINLNQSTLTAGSTSNAEAATIGGQLVFSPTSNNASLAANGGSTTFTFSGIQTGASWTPTVVSVDGDANGTTGANWTPDGIDHIARAAATGAISVAIAYENNKLPNTGDANYPQYDNFLWSAQQYIISGNKVAFDPHMPGYAFVPPQAMNALDIAQDNPEVASYLTAGLQSCFAGTKADYVYAFRAQTLKGYPQATPTTGTMGGVIPPRGAYTPPGYNVNTVVDDFSTASANDTKINFTETSTTAPDYWFGLLTYMTLSSFPNTAAIAAKFGTSGQTAACSPFNGPGGSTNPYFTIALNGQNVAARFTGSGSQCQNACTSTLVADPVPYSYPGDTFTPPLGTPAYPFLLDPSQSTACIENYLSWAQFTDVNGNIVSGLFSVPVSKRGVLAGYSWQQCGTPGAAC